LAKQSKPKAGRCQCGALIKPTEIAGRWFVHDKCEACAEIHKAQQAKQSLRQARKTKAARMRRALSDVIPPLFAAAHIRDLSNPFLVKVFEHRDYQGLLLWGSPGVGKTYAMAALARFYILRKKKCKRISYENLCLQIRDTYKPSSKKTELDVIKPLVDCDCLFLEDLGTTVSVGQQESDFSLRTFLVLLDSRLEACRPTFITTNKSVESLGISFDERVASRLHYFKVLEVSGSDKRSIDR